MDSLLHLRTHCTPWGSGYNSVKPARLKWHQNTKHWGCVGKTQVFTKRKLAEFKSGQQRVCQANCWRRLTLYLCWWLNPKSLTLLLKSSFSCSDCYAWNYDRQESSQESPPWTSCPVGLMVCRLILFWTSCEGKEKQPVSSPGGWMKWRMSRCRERQPGKKSPRLSTAFVSGQKRLFGHVCMHCFVHNDPFHPILVIESQTVTDAHLATTDAANPNQVEEDTGCGEEPGNNSFHAAPRTIKAYESQGSSIKLRWLMKKKVKLLQWFWMLLVNKCFDPDF